jgi:hypothetical protein
MYGSDGPKGPTPVRERVKGTGKQDTEGRERVKLKGTGKRDRE